MSKKKIRRTFYVTDKTSRGIDAYAARRGLEFSAVAEAAFKQYLSGTSDPQLIMRRLNNLSSKVDTLRGEAALYGEMNHAWCKAYLVNTPQLPPTDRQQTTREAKLVYREIRREMDAALSSGNTLVAQLTAVDEPWEGPSAESTPVDLDGVVVP